MKPTGNWHLNPLPRKPDVFIGGERRPYLRRWYILRTPWGGFNLHHICRDDDDRALHDHPWATVSVILRGGYFEVKHSRIPFWSGFGDKPEELVAEWHGAGSVVGIRSAVTAHRLALAKNPITGKPVGCWTLFFMGRWVRDWGFHCPKGWRHWREFCDPADTGLAGKGCE